jgi:hypothetical protein
MILLGIDPGKTTGWGQVELKEDRKLHPLGYGETKDESGLDLLDLLKSSDLIVIESFLVRPKHARGGAFDYDDMVAPRVIGSLQTLCKMNEKKFHMQPASIKPVGYGFLGKEYKRGKKGMHKWDALAHVAYYAVKNLNALPSAAH